MSIPSLPGVVKPFTVQVHTHDGDLTFTLRKMTAKELIELQSQVTAPLDSPEGQRQLSTLMFEMIKRVTVQLPPEIPQEQYDEWLKWITDDILLQLTEPIMPDVEKMKKK